MARPTKYSPEVRERAVRMVRSTGRSTRRNGRRSVRSRRSSGARARRCGGGCVRRSATRDNDLGYERHRMKELERENFELRCANEILRNASAYFAQAELDRRGK